MSDSLSLKLKVSFFCTSSQKEPVRDWIQEQPKEDMKIIGEDIKTVQFGWPVGMPVVRKIENKLWEVRSRVKDGIVRTFFTVDNNRMILLHILGKSLPRYQQMNLR